MLGQRPGNRSLRSVDRECVGRVIEPRKEQSGSRRFRNDGRQKRHVGAPSVPARRGRRAGHAHIGDRQEPVRLCLPPLRHRAPGRPDRNCPGPPGDAPPPRKGAKREEQEWYRRARETERQSALRRVREGWQRSERPMVPTKQGNPLHGEPVEGRGRREARRSNGRHHGTPGGKDGGNFGSQYRLNETSADSGAGEGGTRDGVHHPGPPHRP
jgi:hypothetical protein